MANFLGELFVKIGADTTGLEKGLVQANDLTKKTGDNLTKFITLPLAAAGAAAVKFAIDAEETNAKFNTAFRGIEDQASATAQSLADGYLLSRSEAERLLSSTGDLLKGFGASASEALGLSTSVQELASDLASYNNLQGGASRASEILTKALLGERDALTSLGIKVSEADVQTELLKRGQADLEGQALLLARAQATLTLVTAQSGDAIGDVSRTSDSAANQLRALKANTVDLAVSLGKELLPIAQAVIGGVNDLVGGFANLEQEQKRNILVIAGIVGAIGPAIKLYQSATLVYAGFSAAVAGNTLAQGSNTTALVANKVALIAKSIAEKASIAATTAATGATVAFNAVLAANPIALVTLAIIAATAAIGGILAVTTKAVREQERDNRVKEEQEEITNRTVTAINSAVEARKRENDQQLDGIRQSIVEATSKEELTLLTQALTLARQADTAVAQGAPKVVIDGIRREAEARQQQAQEVRAQTDARLAQAQEIRDDNLVTQESDTETTENLLSLADITREKRNAIRLEEKEAQRLAREEEAENARVQAETLESIELERLQTIEAEREAAFQAEQQRLQEQADLYVSSFASIGSAVGAALASGEDAFKAFKKAALNSLADVISATANEAKAIAAVATLRLLSGDLTQSGTLAAATGQILLIEGLAAAVRNIPLATGGIATGPTNALIGEAGKEMVLPLDGARGQNTIDQFAKAVMNNNNMGSGQTVFNFNSTFDLSNQNEKRKAARELYPFIIEEQKRRGVIA